MPKSASKSAPSSSELRNLTVEQRRELFLAARKKEEPSYQVLDKDWTDELIPYGLITFDYVLGLRGISRMGRVSQVHGDEGVGKSTLTYQIAKNYQEFTGEPLGVFDFEFTGTPSYLAKIGCDMDMVTLRQPTCMEEAVIGTLDLIKEGCRFFIYDSIPWINTKVEEKDIRSKKAFKASYGKHAQVMDKFFKTLLPYVREANGHMMMVNQTRARIDDSIEAGYANDYSYTNKTYVLPGGRIELRLMKAVNPLVPGKISGDGPEKDPFVVEMATPETEGKPCVNLVRARTLKNKVTGAGFREGYIWLRPATHANPGIDNLMSIRALGREYGYIANKGAKWYVGETFDDAIITYPNKDAAIEDLVVNRNPEVHAKLNALLTTAIQADTTGRHSTVVTKEELDMIEGEDNLAPNFDAEEA
jgi:RecA/RadA recombinase